jgi:two-component system, NtrC family, sensor kinase
MAVQIRTTLTRCVDTSQNADVPWVSAVPGPLLEGPKGHNNRVRLFAQAGHGHQTVVGHTAMAKRGQALRKARAARKPTKPAVDLKQKIAELERELAQAMERQAASEERHALVTQAVAEGIYEWDVERNSLWVSSRLIDIFGFYGRELRASDWNGLVHPEDFPGYRTALRECFKGLTPRLDCEYRVRHSDGQYRWIEDRGTLVRNDVGRAIRMVGAITDISERRATDQALREALEQQTATVEVLQVINASPGDLAPVFEAMLDKALGLCEAAFGILWTYDGERMHAAALRGVPPAYANFLTRGSHAVGGSNAHNRLLRGERLVHIADAAEDKAYLSGDALRRATVELGGSRTLLSVPLRKDDTFLGDFVIYRQEVRPFSDRQIALLQNFAAQAVIAMENARLFEELRQSLAQQTATAEVLQIINTSQGELKPVFNAILDNALRLSQSAFGTLRIWDGTRFHLGAQKNVPQAHLDFSAKRMTTLTGIDALGPRAARVLTEKCVLQIVDAKDTDAYRSGVDPMARAIVDLAGARTMMFVPLLSGDVARGTIMVFRTEVRPYSDKEIALLQNFAAQAVIAMDNARLLGELRERQAELRVTFDNMGDGVALFDAAARLVAWNRNLQEMLDLSEAILAKRPSFAELFRYLAARGEFGSADLEAELARRLEDTGRETRYERTRPDGRVIEVRRNPVPGGGFVLIYSDITERKRAEAAIRAARDTAESALRELQAAQASLLHAQKMAALGQLTAGIAHEIKNPLNFVNNFAGLSVELLDELKEAMTQAIGTLDADKRAEIVETTGMLTGNLEKIAEHGRRADGIVRSMLQHSRGDSGERQPTNLNALIEEALNLAYHGARAQDQSFNITMERDFDRDLAPIEVVPQDVTRVFLNLIGNGFYAAHKRGRDGDGTFRPMLKVATREVGGAIEIRVRDNGIGIPPEYREKLFQPFFTTKPTGEGTGLGLSISYDIVTQQHGGTITVDSELGQFTEFTVRLPRRHHPGAGRAA